MPRDAHIPLFLWVATALLVHLLGGGGVNQAADYIEERVELKRFVEGVRSYVKSSHSTVEIALLDENAPVPDPADTAPKEPAPDAKPSPDEPTENEREDHPLPPEPEKKKKEEPPKPEEKKPDEPEKPVTPEKKAAEPKQAVPAQELDLKKAIAVRQHVQDEHQAENPDAKFLGEHNNHVAEESQARITSNDQDDPNPTPGSNTSGVGEQPGDSTENRIAQSEDRPGEEGRAPHDEPAAQQPQASKAEPSSGAQAANKQAPTSAAAKGAEKGGAKASEERAAVTPSPGSKGQAEQREQLGAPEVESAKTGSYLAQRAETTQAEQEGKRGRIKRELPKRRVRGVGDLFGLGAAGVTTNGVALNLTPGLARQAIGTETLTRERLADGERRRSQHVGSWKTIGIERWRSAIENYVPSVKPGNQTALNTARSPFALYLTAIHNRLHPIFADWFLASLDALPASDPQNNPELFTSLEIVLDQDEGRIVRMGVTRHSGVTAFDVSALQSVDRAAPFGTPPREIVSPDGNVYLHWEFHRGPMACSTYNARPFILKVQPKSAPPNIAPPGPRVPEEEPQQRHGQRESVEPARERAL